MESINILHTNICSMMYQLTLVTWSWSRKKWFLSTMAPPKMEYFCECIAWSVFKFFKILIDGWNQWKYCTQRFAVSWATIHFGYLVLDPKKMIFVQNGTTWNWIFLQMHSMVSFYFIFLILIDEWMESMKVLHTKICSILGNNWLWLLGPGSEKNDFCPPWHHLKWNFLRMHSMVCF